MAKDKSRERIWKLISGPLERVLAKKFNIKYDDFDPCSVEGPIVLVLNHACAWDPFMVGLVFRKKMLSYVASEHLLRMPVVGKLAGYAFDIIPHRKGSDELGTAVACLKRLRAGKSVFIAAEGEQSWDGLSGKATESTGKIVKKSGATLVTYKLEGNYLAMPRWSDTTRRGEVHGRVVNIYSPEKLAEMSAAEVTDAINRDLAFDVWKWQREKEVEGGNKIKFIDSKGRAAEGLERALYICPACRQIGGLSTCGDELSCSCGMRVRFTENGFFDPAEPFATIKEWDEWEREEFARILYSGDASADGAGDATADAATADSATLFSDDDVELSVFKKGHKPLSVTRVSIALKRTQSDVNAGAAAEADAGAATTAVEGADAQHTYAFVVGDECFDVKDIFRMSMTLSKRLLFTVGERYFEIKSNNSNLRKYAIAWELLKKEE